MYELRHVFQPFIGDVFGVKSGHVIDVRYVAHDVVCGVGILRFASDCTKGPTEAIEAEAWLVHPQFVHQFASLFGDR